MLRVTTWLAPSLPLPLFELLCLRIAAHTGLAVDLRSETRFSGPEPGCADPFRAGAIDVGFLCAPSWAALAAPPDPSVVAVPALPVPLDARAAGRPVYWSDVIVPAHSPARSFADLAGTRWAYNDTCSLSGWLAMRARVPDPDAFFRTVVRSGSHLASILEVVAGRADGAAIDSTVLGWVLAAEPWLKTWIRVLASWGPHPIQPVVARAGLDPEIVAGVAAALRSFDPREGAQSPLARFGFAGFVAEAPAPTVRIPIAAHPPHAGAASR